MINASVYISKFVVNRFFEREKESMQYFYNSVYFEWFVVADFIGMINENVYLLDVSYSNIGTKLYQPLSFLLDNINGMIQEDLHGWATTCFLWKTG